MACNLAVSITKAVLSPEQAAQLLDPAMLAEALRQYLLALGMVEGDFSVYQGASGVTATVRGTGYASLSMSIQAGRVSITGTRGNEALAQQIQDDLADLVSKLAQNALAAQVAEALRQMAGGQPITGEQIAVDDAGVTRLAYRYSVSI